MGGARSVGIGPFAGSAGSRRDAHSRNPACGARVGMGGGAAGGHTVARRVERRQQGVALVVVMTVIAILTIYLTEMLQTNATAFHVAVSQRDKVKAEYLAKSGLNLTRLLIAREPEIRKVVAPMYRMLVGRPPPQLNVWDFADTLLAPFVSPSQAQALNTGIDFGQMEGLTETGGEIEVIAVPENSKINVSNALFLSGDRAKLSLALQLFALTGGGQLESPYDAMFEQPDADGQFSTRLDIVSAIIDWWDFDEQRTVFDPGAGTVASAGSEDDIYTQFKDPYLVKNAPFDSLQELRMVRGVGDDFWANFVEEDPMDPRTRHVTIYGSGAVNPNQAPPMVTLARVCSFVPEQPLCQDPTQQAAFIQLFQTARFIVPVSVFTRPQDFVDFVQGKGDGKSPYGMLVGMLGPENPLMLWQPLVIPQDRLKDVTRSFITEAAIFTVQVTGRVGRAEVRLSSVVNFHRRWTPPPPNPGKMPVLGILHHYRVD